MNGVMSARLRDYRLLWRAAMGHENPRSAVIIHWILIVSVIVLGAALAVKSGPRAALTLCWCAASAMFLLNWMWRFLPGAVKLNAPAYAKLVPQARQRLVELSSLACCLGLAGIATAPYPDAGQLGAWLFWIVVFIVGGGLAAAGHRTGNAIVLAACFSSLFIARLPAAPVALLSHPLVVVLSLPVYAGLIYLANRAMFPQAGERHWEMVARRARWVSAAGKSDPLVEQLVGKQAKGWYAATLRRDGARRDHRRLALHALGPVHHRGEFVVPLGYMAVVVFSLGIFTSWRVDPGVAPALGWLFASMILVVPLTYCVRLGHVPASLAAEQSLVRLAPAMPASAAAFNLRLGRAMLRQALLAWALAAGTAVLLTALGGAGPDTLLRVASLACMVLPVVAVPLRDHASRTHGAAGVAATLLLVSLVESLLAGAVVNALSGMPILPVAALVSIGFTVFVVVRRLRAMRRAPCAFPAGRMD